jgi:hypothetical protein
MTLFGLTHVDLLSREIRGEVVRLQGNRVRIRQSPVPGS